MKLFNQNISFRRSPSLLLVTMVTLALASGCASKRSTSPGPSTSPSTSPQSPSAGPSTSPATPSGPSMTSSSSVFSNARTPEQYRIELAKHVLAKSASRVLATPLPNPLHGIAVVEMTISRDGKLLGITPLRIPSHAPETRAWISELMQAASPLPQPQFATASKPSLVVTETWFFTTDGKFHMRALQPPQVGQ
jgi:periplasmic protein TonB